MLFDVIDENLSPGWDDGQYLVKGGEIVVHKDRTQRERSTKGEN
jgi:hypothetical protein